MSQPIVHGELGATVLNPEKTGYLALGANLTSIVGAPEITLRVALDHLEKYGATIRDLSVFYSTPAYPAGNGPDYVNAVAMISADCTAAEVLAWCHETEAELGRERITRWGQRTLDLDLLAWGDVVLPDLETHAAWRDLAPEQQIERTPDQLILPHPRLQDRAFVLVPFADVAPDWVHPILGKTVAEMRDALDPADLRSVKPLV